MSSVPYDYVHIHNLHIGAFNVQGVREVLVVTPNTSATYTTNYINVGVPRRQ